MDMFINDRCIRLSFVMLYFCFLSFSLEYRESGLVIHGQNVRGGRVGTEHIMVKGGKGAFLGIRQREGLYEYPSTEGDDYERILFRATLAAGTPLRKGGYVLL